jgi:hypothetical protein
MSQAITTLVSRTTVASAIKTQFQRDVIEIADGMLIADKWATNGQMSKGEGNTMRKQRFLRVAENTTADTENTVYGYLDAKALTTNYIEITPNMYSDRFVFSKEVDWDSFLTSDQYKKEIASQLARSMDTLTINVLSTQGLRHRIDKDTTYQKACTISSTSTTTSLISTTVNSVDFTGGYATFTNPQYPNYDVTRAISAASVNTLTVGAFNHTPANPSYFRASVNTGLSAKPITTAGIIDVMAMHRMLQTESFPAVGFRGILHAAQEADMYADAEWKLQAEYLTESKYSNYRFVRWLDTTFAISSQVRREDVDGTYNRATGAVYVAPVFGANAYDIIKWSSGSGPFGVEWSYKDQADSIDMNNRIRGIGWLCRFGAVVDRATSVIDLCTTATGLTLDTIV